MNTTAKTENSADFEIVPPSPRETIAPSPREAHVDRGGETRGSNSSGLRLIMKSEVDPVRQLPLHLGAQKQTRIPAIVSGLDEHSVKLRCRLPTRFVEISVSRQLVPNHFQLFGTPVYVGVDRDSPYMPLVISRRDAPQDGLKIPKELSEWLNEC